MDARRHAADSECGRVARAVCEPRPGGVLEALEAATEFADEMRASHPFLGILSEADVIEIRRRVRSEP